MIAVLIWSGLVSPVSGAGRVAVPPYDRGVLSEIARDVLRRGATGGNQSVPIEGNRLLEGFPGAPGYP
jgi:hypothetical protein